MDLVLNRHAIQAREDRKILSFSIKIKVKLDGLRSLQVTFFFKKLGTPPEKYLNQRLGDESLRDLFSIFQQELNPGLPWMIYWLIFSFCTR